MVRLRELKIYVTLRVSLLIELLMIVCKPLYLLHNLNNLLNLALPLLLLKQCAFRERKKFTKKKLYYLLFFKAGKSLSYVAINFEWENYYQRRRRRK